MLRVHWNGLAAGDHVLVHDPEDPEHALVPGVVALVEVTSSTNVIAVRLQGRARGRTVRPQRFEVHNDPPDHDEQCWRCDRPTMIRKPIPLPRSGKARGAASEPKDAPGP
jgi:hypothetical protein